MEEFHAVFGKTACAELPAVRQLGEESIPHYHGTQTAICKLGNLRTATRKTGDGPSLHLSHQEAPVAVRGFFFDQSWMSSDASSKAVLGTLGCNAHSYFS
jgi:hypothetical protein